MSYLAIFTDLVCEQCGKGDSRANESRAREKLYVIADSG